MFPGVHRVRKVRADGRVSEYWYAWRGGPQILAATAASDVLLQAEVARRTVAAARAYDEERRPTGGDRRFLYGLITRYLVAMGEDAALAPRTKADRRKHLDRVREALGELELNALESRRARSFLIGWRDGFKATPKTADELLGALSTVLQWAADRGELSRNPLTDFPRLYKVNRAEHVWEPHQLATLLAHADEEFALAVRLAALTGLREGDLVRVPRNAVGDHAIVWQTGKSRGRTTIVIPLTQPLRQLLAEIPAHRATTILASRRNRPWKTSGLAAGLRRARLAALAHARKIHGPDAQSGIEGLRFHDLRGTAATNFIRAGLSLDDVATILGWKRGRIEAIAARYVTGQEIGLAMVERIRRNAAGTKAVNRAVNRARKAGLKAV